MFEERMRFPTSDALSIKDNLPWVMKKIYYLKTNENRDVCLNLLYKDKDIKEAIEYDVQNGNR